ncbi:MAG TPA: 5-formyltetrahydrofolate cyclo-ligase [Burkholderiales bacterium]
MDAAALTRWRLNERDRLVALRDALDDETCRAWRLLMDSHLERAFPGLAGATIGLCWPIRNEYDPRHLAHRLRARGARTALPVVTGRGKPLVFRAWTPGVRLARGALGIPYPADTPELTPQAMLVPMNGWDPGGFRLGYGAGFFDRTLAACAKKPVVIGVSYEMARLETIRPQAWDIPMDWVVTERGVYRREEAGLVFLGAPPAGGAAALASPVCYAAELDPGYFGAPNT